MKISIQGAAELAVSMTVIGTLLAACGGGGGGGGGVTPATIPPISGTAAKGIISGATVTAYCGGVNAKPQVSIGTAITVADGSYSITPTQTCSLPVEVVLTTTSGTRMLDEATGNSVSLPSNFTMSAYIASVTGAITAHITPFTNMAAAVIDGASGVTPTSDNVSAAINAVVSSVLGGDALLYNAKPMTPASAVASTDPEIKKLAALLTAISAHANSLYMAASGVTGASAVPDTGAATLQALKELEDSAKATISMNAASGVMTHAPISGASAPVEILNHDITDSKSHINNENSDAQNISDNTTVPLPPAPTRSTTITATTPGITTAKNMFTSLRTSLQTLSNPSQTGFLDVEMAVAKTDLKNTSMHLNSTFSKINVMNFSINLLNNIKASGITGLTSLPQCPSQLIYGMTGTCYAPDINNPNNTIVHFGSGNNGNYSGCMTNSLPTTAFVAGTMPAGIKVSCQSMIDQPSHTATTYSYYTFNSQLSPDATVANQYIFTSSTTTSVYLINSSNAPTVTTSNSVAGTVTQVKTGTAFNSLAVAGKLADGVTLAYDQVAINAARTYPSGTAPAGAPQGSAMANYVLTGSIASVKNDGATAATIALLTGTSISHLEDVNGNYPSTLSNYDLGTALTAVARFSTPDTQVDGTISASNYVCDLSGTHCAAGNVSFTGSLKDLAHANVGTFLTGTVTNTESLSSYDATKPANAMVTSSNTQNRIHESATISGIVTNNNTGTVTGTVTNTTVSSSSVYNLTFTGNNNVDNQKVGSFTYTAPNSTTVTASYNSANNNVTATSGGVTAIIGKDNNGNPTGNVTLSNSTTVLGTISGNTVNFTDGSFMSMN
jgi:hypothetical protein